MRREVALIAVAPMIMTMMIKSARPQPRARTPAIPIARPRAARSPPPVLLSQVLPPSIAPEFSSSLPHGWTAAVAAPRRKKRAAQRRRGSITSVDSFQVKPTSTGGTSSVSSGSSGLDGPPALAAASPTTAAVAAFPSPTSNGAPVSPGVFSPLGRKPALETPGGNAPTAAGDGGEAGMALLQELVAQNEKLLAKIDSLEAGQKRLEAAAQAAQMQVERRQQLLPE